VIRQVVKRCLLPDADRAIENTGGALGVAPLVVHVHDELASVRHRAAADLFARHAPAIRAVARRVSLCADDADDACQRALLILLTKAPPLPAATLLAWMRTVTRREALAVRRARERLLAGNPGGDATDHLFSERPETPERVERRERALERLRSLTILKPDERRAIVLQARGYSYAEITTITGWTHTKVNRCLAEGRARLRASAP
jgi:RNA polymerase sigma factor (sigma-70 family)